MSTTISTIVSDVRLNIDEIALNDADFQLSDDTELDAIIMSKIGEAVNFIHGNADVNLMDSGSITNNTVTNGTIDTASKRVTVQISNCLRVIYAKLANWRWAVSNIVDYTNQEDVACITDPWSGANYERPAVVQKKVGDTTTLYLYKAKESTIENCEVGYIPVVSMPSTMTGTSTISVDSKLYRAMINYLSGLVLITFNDKARAQEFIEIAMVECGIKPSEVKS